MRITPMRWLCAVVLAACLLPARTQPPAAPTPVWRLEDVTLPVQPLAEPRRWVKSPVGPGEFFFRSCRPDPQNRQVTPYQLVPTYSGLLAVRVADGVQTIVPAVFGQPCTIIGQFEGRVWVQQRDYTLVGLDPNTLKVTDRLRGLAGLCFGIDAASVWCYQGMEVMPTGGYVYAYVTGFGAGIVEYTRAGKEKRRFPANGTCLPTTEIHRAILEPDAVWVIASPYLGTEDTGKIYGDGQLFRIDRTTGKLVQIETGGDVHAGLLNLPDRFIWTDPQISDSTPGKTIPVSMVDKKTLAFSQPARIPVRYARQLCALQDGRLWCKTPNDGSREQVAVFALDGGQRIPIEEAGPPPAIITQENHYPGFSEYMMLGSSVDCVLATELSNTVYEFADAGDIRVRDCKPIEGARRLYSYDGRFVVNTVLGNAGIFSTGTYNGLVKFLPGESRAVCSQVHTPNLLAASDRRLWFADNRRLITCSADLKPVEIPLPFDVLSSNYDRRISAAEDVLYLYRNGDILQVDGQSGKLTTMDSWRRQAPKRLLQCTRMEVIRLPKKGIAFIFTACIPGEARAPRRYDYYLATYDPAADTWAFPSAHFPKGDFTILDTPRGILCVPWRDGHFSLHIGARWVALTKLPLTTQAYIMGAATRQYLYLQTGFGLYRMRWDDLL